MAMILMCLSMVCVSAEDIIDEDIIDDVENILYYEYEVTGTANDDELEPLAAGGCGNLSSWYDIDHSTKSTILSDVQGNYKSVVGDNPNIYYNSDGTIVLCGVGTYAGKTYVTDLQREWYL